MRLNLKIDGMGCDHCIVCVREALEKVDGIKILDVKIGSAEIEAENDSVLSEIKEKLDDAGYDLVQFFCLGTKVNVVENDIKLGAGIDNSQENESKKLELKIDGISCQACVAKIERKLSKTNGVDKALVNISNNMADIEYDEKEIKASEIMKIIEKLGYTPKRREDLKDKEEEIKAQKRLKNELTKSKIVIVLSFILMYISMSHMLGLPLPNILNPEINIVNYVLAQFIKQCKNTRDFSRETCTREYELYENFSKHIGKLVCRHGAKPCNKETELLGTLKASITTT